MQSYSAQVHKLFPDRQLGSNPQWQAISWVAAAGKSVVPKAGEAYDA